MESGRHRERSPAHPADVGLLGDGQGQGGAISPWAPQNENPNANVTPVPLSQAVLDAQHFNFITAHNIAYQGEVAAMKSANPILTLYAYQNATFVTQSNEGTLFDPPWYEYDATGEKVTSTATGNYLMNPSVPGWVQNRITICETNISQSGYDGCFLDVLGVAPLSTP